MVEYLDMSGKKLEKGFYYYSEMQKLWYFTGDYNKNELPIFNKEGNVEVLGVNLIGRINKISKEEIKRKLDASKKRNEWLEEMLSK
jgi:hypothetical protein